MDQGFLALFYAHQPLMGMQPVQPEDDPFGGIGIGVDEMIKRPAVDDLARGLVAEDEVEGVPKAHLV